MKDARLLNKCHKTPELTTIIRLYAFDPSIKLILNLQFELLEGRQGLILCV